MTNEEKVRIVRRHTEESVPLIDLSDEYGVSIGQIYAWKRQMAEAAVSRCLLAAGTVTRDQLRRAITYQRANGGRTVDALIELGFLSSEAFVRFMAAQPGIPSLKLRQYSIDANVAKLVTREFASERLALPIDRMGRLLTVAMACPLDEDTLRDISKLTGLRAKPVFADQSDIEWAIKSVLREDQESRTDSEEDYPIAQEGPQPLRPVPPPDILNMIKQIDALPLIPGSIHLLRQVIAAGDVGEESLARIIRMDPLMTARLLALANSETFGQAGQVYSLQQGIRLLGAEKACTLVSAAETVLLFRHWSHFDFQTFWTDALCCAQAAALLAKHLEMDRQDDFFTAGLLHDIGRIALYEILPLHYAKTDIDASGTELLIQENEIVGMPHTLAGYALAKHWNLPEEFAEGIRSHHFPEQAQNSSDFAAIVSIGNIMAERVVKSGDIDDEALDECRAAMKMLGLEKQALRTLFEDFSALLPSLFLDENDG